MIRFGVSGSRASNRPGPARGPYAFWPSAQDPSGARRAGRNRTLEASVPARGWLCWSRAMRVRTAREMFPCHGAFELSANCGSTSPTFKAENLYTFSIFSEQKSAMDFRSLFFTEALTRRLANMPPEELAVSSVTNRNHCSEGQAG